MFFASFNLNLNKSSFSTPSIHLRSFFPITISVWNLVTSSVKIFISTTTPKPALINIFYYHKSLFNSSCQLLYIYITICLPSNIYHLNHLSQLHLSITNHQIHYVTVILFCHICPLYWLLILSTFHLSKKLCVYIRVSELLPPIYIVFSCLIHFPSPQL